MITINKKFKFSSATGNRIAYTLTADSSCVQISNSAGEVTSDTIVEFQIDFSDIDCFDTLFTLTSYDVSCNIPVIRTFKLNSPCLGLSGAISFTPNSRDPYRFTISPIGGAAPYTYQWFFDNTLFSNARNNTTSSIALRLINTFVPDFTTLTCIITDANGCSTTVDYIHTFCRPIIDPVTVTLNCIPAQGNFDMGGFAILEDTSSCSQSIDWTTLSFNTTQFAISNEGPNLSILAKSTNSTETVTVLGTVNNSIGITGQVVLNLITKPCEIVKTPVVPPQILVVPDALGATDEVFLSVDSFIPIGQEIDTSTFTFIAKTGQTLVSPTQLTAVNGAAVYECPTNKIKYTIGTVTEPVELIEFQFETKAGIKTNVAKYYIDFESLAVPVAVADSATIAAGASSTINISTNDTGDKDLTSYEILTVDAGISVINNNNGTVTVIPGKLSEGSYTFTYRFKSTSQILSNTATATITVQNAGFAVGNPLICPLASISLLSFLSGSITSGGTWTQASSNPSSLTITDPLDVDFSSANAGVYLFTYTIGSSVATIAMTLLNDSVTITSVSTPSNNSLSPTIGSVVNFQTIGVESAANITITVNFNAGTNIQTYSPDFWSNGSGFVAIAYDQAAGSYAITVTAIDRCGTTRTSNTVTKVI